MNKIDFVYIKLKNNIKQQTLIYKHNNNLINKIIRDS